MHYINVWPDGSAHTEYVFFSGELKWLWKIYPPHYNQVFSIKYSQLKL